MRPLLAKLSLLLMLLYTTGAVSAPAVAQQPAIVTAGPSLFEGSVQGHVLAEGSNATIAGARVWLVNATKPNTTYGSFIADRNGHYYFMNVAPLGPDAYRLRAEKGNDSAYSEPFGVGTLKNISIDVFIRMKPANMAVSASRGFVVANGSDHVRITALVYDSTGHPVPEGHVVQFTAHGYPPGSLSGSIEPDRALTDSEGRATAEYGRVPEIGASSRVTIGAVTEGGVNAATAVDLRLPDRTPPETTLAASGEPDNAGGFISDVACTLTAKDPGGWGVDRTYYRIGDSGWQRYEGPFTITGEGATTISYYSTDLAGNQETPKRRTVVIHRK